MTSVSEPAWRWFLFSSALPSFLSVHPHLPSSSSLAPPSLRSCFIGEAFLTCLTSLLHFSRCTSPFFKAFFFSLFKAILFRPVRASAPPRSASPALPGNERNSEWNAEVGDTHTHTRHRVLRVALCFMWLKQTWGLVDWLLLPVVVEREPSCNMRLDERCRLDRLLIKCHFQQMKAPQLELVVGRCSLQPLHHNVVYLQLWQMLRCTAALDSSKWVRGPWVDEETWISRTIKTYKRVKYMFKSNSSQNEPHEESWIGMN